VVGFLIADQVCEGNIDVGKTMVALSSELDSTAYKDIAFKHVLDMSSGVFANAQKQTVPSYQEITRKGISMMDQLSAPKKPNSEPGAKFD
jgi:CubicO group peptidase (beta-lactamase class C family)